MVGQRVRSTRLGQLGEAPACQWDDTKATTLDRRDVAHVFEHLL